MRRISRLSKLRKLGVTVGIFVLGVIALQGSREGTPVGSLHKASQLSDQMYRAIEAGRGMMRHRRFAYVMFLNSAYIPFTQSWICNTLLEDETVLQNTIFFADCTETRIELESFRSDIDVFTIPIELSGSLEYGHLDYYQLTLHRLKIQNELLQNGISVMLVEADAAWLKPGVDSQLSQLFRLHEIISADNHNYATDAKEISAGFSGYKSTPSVKKLFSTYVRRYEATLKKYEGQGGFIGDVGEQVLLSRMLSTLKFNVHWLDSCEYASGAWYTFKEYSARCELSTVKVLQNNYLLGNEAKVTRAKLWGHWYLDSDEKRCSNKRSSPGVAQLATS